MLLTFKVKVPDHLVPSLEDLYSKSKHCVDRMLENRGLSSSKYYKEIPCVLSKSLISKYQRNKKLKSVKNLVLPICGDKGKIVKIVGKGLRVPALFKKEVIPVTFPKQVIGFIRQIEFFKKNKVWFMSYSYDTIESKTIEVRNVIGVDRNSKQNVVAVANLKTGEVLRLGPDCSAINYQFRKKKAKLQKEKKYEALKKLSGKQKRKTKYINHKVSRSVVNYACKTLSAIVLEDLGEINKGKIKHKVQKSQWSFYQLLTFIKYKAALAGVPVCLVNPAYTSKSCSRCGSINNVNGKHFKCSSCGHVDHRDSNAAFNIAYRGLKNLASSNQKLNAGIIGNTLNWRLA